MVKDRSLSPDSFKVNEKGEVVINKANLLESLKVKEAEAASGGEVKVSVSFTF